MKLLLTALSPLLRGRRFTGKSKPVGYLDVCVTLRHVPDLPSLSTRGPYVAGLPHPRCGAAARCIVLNSSSSVQCPPAQRQCKAHALAVRGLPAVFRGRVLDTQESEVKRKPPSAVPTYTSQSMLPNAAPAARWRLLQKYNRSKWGDKSFPTFDSDHMRCIRIHYIPFDKNNFTSKKVQLLQGV